MMSPDRPRLRSELKVRRQSTLQPKQKKWWQLRPKVLVALGGITTLITLISSVLGYAVLVPRITVDGSNSGDDASSVSFTITNSGFVQLDEVRFYMKICNMMANGIQIIGQGCGKTSARQAPPNCKWCMKTMPMDAKFTIDLADIWNESDQPSWRRRMPLGSKTAVIVSYEPWPIPFRWERHFPYILKQSNDGHIYWAPTSEED
jgi:hypothetical protein